MALPTFWRAEHASRHFTFEAFGATRAGALNAMLALLDEHARAYPVSATWAAETLAEIISDGMVRELRFGVGYRDGEEVICES